MSGQFNDLVLAHILSQLEPADVLRMCAPVSRQWRRVAHAGCRHVAVHVLEHHAPFEAELAQRAHSHELTAVCARTWCAAGRVRWVASALLRVEWDDWADRPWSVHADSREVAFIPEVLRVLGYFFLAAASLRDAPLLARLVDDGAIKAISFFLRPRYFNPNGVPLASLADNKAIRASVWCLANIAALPDGRAVLARADVHDVLLDMLVVAARTPMNMVAELCALALANLYCDAPTRARALAHIARVAEVISLVFDTAFELRDVHYHACRAVRELVGKLDAKLINVSLDAVLGSQLLERMVDNAFKSVPDRASSMVLTVLSEIGRTAVRPSLAATFIRPNVTALVTSLADVYALNDMDRSYSASVCLAQMALSREFVAALTDDQIAAIGRLGTFLFDRWNRNLVLLLQYDVAMRLTMAVLHIFSQVPHASKAALEVPAVAAPSKLVSQMQIHQMMLLAGNLLMGRVTATQCKSALKRFANQVSENRAAVGLSRLTLSQFVQQRPTWTDTDDVFGIGNALVFDANAFDAIENAPRPYEWIGMQIAVNTNDLVVPFTVQAVFKVAGMVAMRSTRRFNHANALRNLLNDELCALANQGVLAYPFAMSAVLEAVVTRVLSEK